MQSEFKQVPDGYKILNVSAICRMLEQSSLRNILGGHPDSWSIKEVGDGNLNLVFLVRGQEGGLAVKQALPYVRIVGESWPLPLSRSYYEYSALVLQSQHAPKLVPKVYHFDKTLALVAMELLEQHIIMRHGMISGTIYPRFADDISTFIASTLFNTSTLNLESAEFKKLVADFAGNSALCKITEDLIFTEPYMIAENNRWTSPWLDNHAAKIRADADLKVAVSKLKLKFMGSTEALIHGDLHTGSVMLTTDDTRVIDPEFAFMGPMGFDTGAIIANLILNYFSQIGHEQHAGARDAYCSWILETVEQVWTLFRSKFLNLWRNNGKGDAYPVALFTDPLDGVYLYREQEAFMDRLFHDTIGFAAAKMIRRILGLAHNIDFENIPDPKIRATAEARSLLLARDMMVNVNEYNDIRKVTTAAKRINGLTPELSGE